MIKMFKYNVNAYFAKAETTLRTDDFKIAVYEFKEYASEGVTCDIVDCVTGEVLAIANNAEHTDYLTPAVAVKILEILMTENWGVK
jgi:hypothetical protein